MPFLNPWLLTGLALASVPVIIHLLNRRRFTVIEWAPMKYLRLTLKSNRRRLRIEQWLLLLLRMLIIAVLFFALARPKVSRTGAVAWLTGKNRTSRVLVLDDSLSMGYQVRGRSALARGREALAGLVDRIGAQDSVTVLTTSRLDQPLVAQTYLSDASMLLQDIANLTVTHTPGNWPATFEAIDRHLDASPFPMREVVIVTDLRRQGWAEAVNEQARKWAQADVSLTIIDVGSRAESNLALLDLKQTDPIALPNAPIRFTATVRNDQDHAIPAAQATLTVGSKGRPVLLPALEPGQTGSVPITVRFDEPGHQSVSLTLPDDALPEDNRRNVVVDVRPGLDLLLVDGEPDTQPFASETDFLAASFSVGDIPWRVLRETDAQWLADMDAAGHNGQPDVLVLANLATLPQHGLRTLEQWVSAGMGLIVFVGDQVDTVHYNQHFYADGQGLLPVRLEGTSDEPVAGLVVREFEDSPVGVLRALVPAALATIASQRIMHVRPPAPDAKGVRVLATWNNDEQSPAIIEKTVGRGRVLLVTTTADKAWTNWPAEMTYVLMVREAALTLAQGHRQSRVVAAGEPILDTLEQGDVAVEAQISVPGVESLQPVEIVPAPGDPTRQTLEYARTMMAGIYSINWTDGASNDRVNLFAVNPGPQESDLTPTSPTELAAMLAPLEVTFVGASELDAALASRGDEIWRQLVVVLLVMMLVESVMAMWVGRQR